MDNNATETRTLVRIDPAIAAAIKPMAAANYQSLAGAVNKALSDWLAANGVERPTAERRERVAA